MGSIHAPDLKRREDDLRRIRVALEEAAALVGRFAPGAIDVRYKEGNSPVSEADLAVDERLRRILPQAGEGWLSEETADDRARLDFRRVWVVDPIDGTREFLEGIAHWSVSIALVEDGIAVAGGIYNPAADELFLGSQDTGLTVNGMPARASKRSRLAGATVIVSRWAVRGKRGRRWANVPFTLRPIGPIAYGLALIAAGRADAMWSRSPKPEWDVGAGTALIHAGGGCVTTWDGAPPRFNRWPPRLPGIVATAAPLERVVRNALATGTVPT